MFLPKQHKRLQKIAFTSPDYDIWPYSNCIEHDDGDLIFFNLRVYNQSSTSGPGQSSNRTQGLYSKSLVKIDKITGMMDKAFQQNTLPFFDYYKDGTGIILFLAKQSDGKFIAGGSFSNLNGVSGRNALVRFNPDGTLDEAFCINATDGGKFGASTQITSLVVQSDGKIIVGGTFVNYGGTTNRNYFIRLNSDGIVDDSFCINASDGPKFNGPPWALAGSVQVQPDGKILVGGQFANYNGTTGRNYLVRLNEDGTLDTAFCANAVDGSKFTNAVQNIGLLPDGRIILTGAFSNYGAVSGRSYALMLNSNGTTDTAFCAAAVDGNKFTSFPIKVVVGDGNILFFGKNYNYTPLPMLLYNLFKISYSGVVDLSFSQKISVNSINLPINPSNVETMPSDAFISGSSYYIVGRLFLGGPTIYRGIVKINLDGTPDLSFYIKPKFVNDSFNLNNVGVSTSFVAYDPSIVIDDDKILGFCNSDYPSYQFNGVSWSAVNGLRAADGYMNAPTSLHIINKYGESEAMPSSFINFNGIINVLAKDSLGRIYVGGQFTNYSLVANRNYFVRLNADYSVDTAFCANASDGGLFTSSVTAIYVQDNGKIIVAGNFLNYRGTTGRNYLIRLNSDGTLDTAFCSAISDGNKFNSIPTTITEAGGKIFIGGSFTSYAGTTGRNNLVVFDSNTLLSDPSWLTSLSGAFNSTVFVVALSTFDNTKIYVAGFFSNFGGVTGRSRLIRFNISDGSVDTAFCANAVDGGKFSSSVVTLAQLVDGSIICGGNFSNYSGVTSRNRMVKLSEAGILDVSFCNNASDNAAFGSNITKIYKLSNDDIVVCGSFKKYKRNNYTPYVVKLDSSGNQLPYLFEKNVSLRKNNNYYDTVPSTSITLSRCLPLSDGSLILGFDNPAYMGISQMDYVVKFDSSGNLDDTFNANAVLNTNVYSTINGKFNQPVSAIVPQSDGKIIFGGNFSNYGGVSGRNRLIRVNTDGTLDTAFSVNANASNKFNNTVRAVALLPDGSIVAGGDFTNFGGTTGRNRLVKLNPDGTTNTLFCTNAVDGSKINSSITSIVVSSDSIFVAGAFTSYAATTGRSYLLKFNFDGVLDTAYCANAVDGTKFQSSIQSLDIYPDGSLLAAGFFTSYAGNTSYNRLVKLSPTGLIDTAFSGNTRFGSNGVSRIALNPYDNSIICVGSFTSYDSDSSVQYMIKLNADGTQDTSFTNKFLKPNRFRYSTWLCNYGDFTSIPFTYCDPVNNNTYVLGNFSSYYIDNNTRVADLLIFTREGKIY
jgi:uncharacterized delta-60 repeat protein